MSFPAHPIAATTHPDPQTYHQTLLKGPAIWFDSTLQMWMLAHPDVVLEALHHPDLRVRPVQEMVPRHLIGTPLETFFRSLVRMNDGEAHQQVRPELIQLLHSFSAMQLKDFTHSGLGALSLNNPSWTLKLGLQVMGKLLGVPAEDLDVLSEACIRLTFSLSPLATEGDVETGSLALEVLQALLQNSPHLRDPAVDADLWKNNLLGLLVQTCEATAGLLGLSLLLLKARPELLEDVRSGKVTLQDVVSRAAQQGCPVQNTRRFAARDVTLGEHTLPAGATLLLLLGTASLHPEAPLLTFGAGRHQCPGENLAVCMVTAALETLLRKGIHPSQFALLEYRPSVNTRVPVLLFKEDKL